MERMGELLYKNSEGYEIYGVVMGDVTKKTLSVGVYTVSPTDEMSDIVTVTRREIVKKPNTYADFILDFEGKFIGTEVTIVQNAIYALVNEKEHMGTVNARATMKELHQAFSDYIRKGSEDLKDNTDAKKFIKDGYGYMKTTEMDEFVKENKELGYNRLEILKRLKVMGVLKTGSNRAYDILVSVNGKKERYYKIEMLESTNEENIEETEEVEEINV